MKAWSLGIVWKKEACEVRVLQVDKLRIMRYLSDLHVEVALPGRGEGEVLIQPTVSALSLHVLPRSQVAAMPRKAVWRRVVWLLGCSSLWPSLALHVRNAEAQGSCLLRIEFIRKGKLWCI